MSNKTSEELASEYAATVEENSTTKKAWLAGYCAAYELIEKHIQFLESQLRQANSRIMRLEAEK
jgi:hypothetical protein